MTEPAALEETLKPLSRYEVALVLSLDTSRQVHRGYTDMADFTPVALVALVGMRGESGWSEKGEKAEKRALDDGLSPNGALTAIILSTPTAINGRVR